jgi:hypothetical protein
MSSSNTSPSDGGFIGVLQALTELLSRHPREHGRLVGQDVVTTRSDIRSLLSLDADGNIHFLLTPPAADERRFQRFALRALRISNRTWSVSGHAPAVYLDLMCATADSPAFQRPFLSFCEDVLNDLVARNASPEDAVYRACVRWQRFWTADADRFTIEWLHGLAAELAWLSELIALHGPAVIHSWLGPEGADHDFQTGTELATEVKSSTAMPFRIECNLNQLDPGIFRRLLLICYLFTADPAGETLPMSVAAIEDALRADSDALELFWDRLARVGYRRQLEEQYRQHPYRLAPPSVFRVDDTFPRLTVGSFAHPPDGRISRVRYVVELTGVEPMTLDEARPLLAPFSG